MAHALAIVVSAAARVEAAHARGRRQYATPDNVLVRYDGTVEIRGSRVPAGSDPGADVRALGRLLVALLTNAELDGDAAATIAAAIDHDRGASSAAELARTLVQLARASELTLSQHELGRYARRQIYPRGNLDTPASGVEVPYPDDDDEDLVAGDVDDEGDLDAVPRLARGSQEILEHELPRHRAADVAIDFDKMMRQASEISAPVILPAESRPSMPRMPRASSITPVAFHVPSGTVASGVAGGSSGRVLVQLFAVLMVLGAAWFIVCAAYPDAAATVAALFR